MHPRLYLEPCFSFIPRVFWKVSDLGAYRALWGLLQGKLSQNQLTLVHVCSLFAV